jgi:hypothetical protein
VVTPGMIFRMPTSATLVSIPQSGFLVVTPNLGHGAGRGVAGFNPSVGILGGHTSPERAQGQHTHCFHAPGPDSWYSHCRAHRASSSRSEVSIPQSGFLVVTPRAMMLCPHVAQNVSIPQSGFLVVTLVQPARDGIQLRGFNPSVGILCGHTQSGPRS